MKNKDELIQEQNAIAISMLNYIIEKKEIKNLIQKFGTGLRTNILDPLIKIIEETEALHHLNEETNKSISFIILHQSSKGRQYDGMRMGSAAENMNSREGFLSLLHQMRDLLNDISQCTTIQLLTNYFKAMYDLASIFVHQSSDHNDEIFIQLKSIIMPSADEFSCRVAYEEVDTKKKYYARTFGLFARSHDLIEETAISETTSVADARMAGKSVFKKVSMQERYRVVFNDYLKAKENYDALLNMPTKSLAEKITEAEYLLLNQIQKMINLDIPLNLGLENLIEVDNLAKLNKTWLEKIAEQTETLLVASVSGSMGRLLIALLYFKLIKYSDASIDEIQILTNCAAAHLVFQGHHSFEEVHEASRRAIDALLLIDGLKEGEILRVNDFYKVDANAFLHPSYADRILEDANDNFVKIMPDKYWF